MPAADRENKMTVEPISNNELFKKAGMGMAVPVALGAMAGGMAYASGAPEYTQPLAGAAAALSAVVIAGFCVSEGNGAYYYHGGEWYDCSVQETINAQSISASVTIGAVAGAALVGLAAYFAPAVTTENPPVQRSSHTLVVPMPSQPVSYVTANGFHLG